MDGIRGPIDGLLFLLMWGFIPNLAIFPYLVPPIALLARAVISWSVFRKFTLPAIYSLLLLCASEFLVIFVSRSWPTEPAGASPFFILMPLIAVLLPIVFCGFSTFALSSISVVRKWKKILAFGLCSVLNLSSVGLIIFMG